MNADANQTDGFCITDSRDSQIVEMTGPGDNTIRPLTGKLLELAKAERAKIEACEKERAERQKQLPPEAK